jgi:hypothetical protein
MARDELIDPWSSREMISILSGQHHNGLLPVPLPKGLQIAHKTGTLHDTLNDVGIVFLGSEPYIIAVLTTHLVDLDAGAHFIQDVSRMTYSAFEHVAELRTESQGVSAGGAAQTYGAPAEAPVHAPTTDDWMLEGR